MQNVTKASTVVTGVRLACIAVWIIVILGCVTTYFIYPDFFTAERIALFLQQFRAEIWTVYLLMSTVRGMTLLPSTPLVLAGTILFPGEPWPVFGVSLAGIFLSSSMIYYFSNFLGFADYFEGRKPEFVAKIRQRFEHPTGFVFVAVWAFFPFVPTDAICYAAGTSRMSFWKFIAAILLGESVLCSFYVFSGGYLMHILR
ncbi:MAG: VTT domain-containing protein [Acidobacteriota bacterium]